MLIKSLSAPLHELHHELIIYMHTLNHLEGFENHYKQVVMMFYHLANDQRQCNLNYHCQSAAIG